MKKSSKSIFLFIIIFSLNLSTFNSFVHAGMIETNSLLDASDRMVLIDNSTRFLEQEKVADILLNLGLNQQTVLQRVAALTDEELMRLSENIDQAPAGAGAVEVIGIVFIVLLILELVGVTDIFKKL